MIKKGLPSRLPCTKVKNVRRKVTTTQLFLCVLYEKILVILFRMDKRKAGNSRAMEPPAWKYDERIADQ
jgi:hypothetical protein